MSKAIHKQSDKYSRKEYWEERFEDEAEFDWLGTLGKGFDRDTEKT